jgi:DNA-binding IclR family transcriptional regulator
MAGEIAQATGIPRWTVAPTLSRLVAAGAAERTERPGGGVAFRPPRVAPTPLT